MNILESIANYLGYERWESMVMDDQFLLFSLIYTVLFCLILIIFILINKEEDQEQEESRRGNVRRQREDETGVDEGLKVEQSPEIQKAVDLEELASHREDVEEQGPPDLNRENKEEYNYIQRLRQGLEATRRGFIKRIEALLKGKTTVDHQMIEELEETLIIADLGVRTTHKLLEKINAHIDRHDRVETISELLVQQICEILSSKKSTYELIEKPQVILMVGVNGAGKTTTIAKLAKLHLNQGRKVLVAAADTYRAAAIEQLERWCEVVGVELVKQHEGADPSSVLFEAVNNAKNNAYDVLIIDTAGRLHTKKNLMEELSKMQRTSEKVLPGSPHEVLLVLDATTGQNAIVQAKEFRSATRVTDIVLTKLDGTAKGGIIIGIVDELGIPVKYIGIGERMDDLRPFNASEFTEALFQQ